MSSGLSGTIGTTSAAPMRGCAPSCRRRSIRSRARSTAPSSVSTSSSDSPTSVKAYYEARAPEYDDWWLGTGPFEERYRPGWDEERDALIATLRALPPARTLDVVDSALREDVQPVERQERMLRDGSRWEVYKRFFEPQELAVELGGGETLFAGHWFVAV